MNKWTSAAALAASMLVIVAMPAQATPAKMHHPSGHHGHAGAVAYPDSVMLDGKQYKVCRPGVEDDCVEPRQAGLGFGNRPTDTYHPDKDQHR